MPMTFHSLWAFFSASQTKRRSARGPQRTAANRSVQGPERCQPRTAEKKIHLTNVIMMIIDDYSLVIIDDYSLVISDDYWWLMMVDNDESKCFYMTVIYKCVSYMNHMSYNLYSTYSIQYTYVYTYVFIQYKNYNWDHIFTYFNCIIVILTATEISQCIPIW